MYYKIRVSHTSKPQGRTSEDYHVDWRETETFSSLKGAREWIADRYKPSQRKSKLYRDNKDGEAVHSGWIFGYKDTFYNRGEPPYNAFCEDWVTLHKVEEETVLPLFELTND